ncbi:MAG: hypothetical protein HYR94_11280 [Chloroflexi bacterium]|nr:hypothetical protein [Chloroflexota bacterium]
MAVKEEEQSVHYFRTFIMDEHINMLLAVSQTLWLSFFWVVGSAFVVDVRQMMACPMANWQCYCT